MDTEERRFSIKVMPIDRIIEVPDTMTVLEAAALAGAVLPSSCRNGTCRTCICRLLEGKVRYRVEWPGLSAREKVEGWILPCVALPDSAIVIDQPSARDAADVPVRPWKRGF